MSLVLAARVRACLSSRLRRYQLLHAISWHRSIGTEPTGARQLCTENGLSEQQAVTNHCKRLHLSLADTVRQRRGEMGDDPRPNKGLDPERLQFVLQGYQYTTELVAIARSGIVPTWKVELPQARTPPKNHNSARLFKKALLRSIRQGQADGTYLVVSLSILEQWKNIHAAHSVR